MKLLFVTNVPSPYQLELFGHVAREGLAQVRVLFCMWGYGGRPWGRPELPAGFEVLPHVSLQWALPDLVLSFGIRKRIVAFEPDAAIVGGYMVPGLHRAMTVLTRLGVPWLYWDEFHRFSANPLKRAARLRLLRGALERCSAVLAIGSRAKGMFEEHVGGRKPVYDFPYASDLTRFAAAPRRGAPGRVRFLYSGQLVPRKGVDTLMRAFETVATNRPGAELVIVGDGPSRADLEALVRDDLRPRVRFAGPAGWDEMPRRYAEVDVLAFPSRHDGWGMVVPEAMAAGMPVISTREVGAALDLVKDGETGFLFDRDDDAALAGHMGYFCERPEEVARMGEAARRAVLHLDVREAGRRLIEIAGAHSLAQPRGAGGPEG